MALISSALPSSQNETEPPSNINTRLLWRGSIVTHTGLRLHGLAIVAHSIDVNFTIDPFNPNQPARRLSATSLELEMLRGRDLQAQGLAKLIPDDVYREQIRSEQALKKGGRKARLASLLKGKAPAAGDDLVQDITFSDVECDSDVKLYIDPRCSQTRDWIMSHICKRDLMEVGWTRDALIITLDHSSDDKQPSQLLIFGQATSNPSQSQATNDSIPLQLVIGQRIISPTSQIPRPDDPMPRTATTSFIEKLKPSAPISAPSKNPIPPSSLSQFKSRPQEVPRPNLESKPGRNLFKSTALVDDPKSSVKRSAKLLKRPSNTPGRRLDSYLKPGQTSASSRMPDDTMMLTSRNEKVREKRGLEESDSLSVKRLKSRFQSQSEKYTLPDLRPIDDQDERVQDENDFSMERSPSPSPASFKTTRQFPPVKQYVASPCETSHSQKKQTQTRPPLVSKRESTDSARSITKSNSSLKVDLLPTVQEVEMESSKKATGHLTTNKALIRKLALAALSSRGIEKGHVDFKDLFAAVCRGVQFAMRKELEVQEIDKTLAQGFVEGHLAMYKIMTPVESVMLAMKLGTTT